MPRKILVVDDERDIVRLEQTGLRSEGYEVVTASTGREALEKVFFEKPDLILLDVMLPEIDGFEVLKKLRENPETATIPVIMLTARSEEADVAKGWKGGADLYITKPFELDELMETVQRILEGDVENFPPGPGQRNF
ncbi:MAG: response regulator [Abitibacteriaceae bacterium]|nr:response regulator [Abditibacteriaceae bacterium]